MRLSRNVIFALALMAGVLFGEPCEAVNGDRITMADLGRVIPAFQALDPGIIVGYTPAPGLERIFTATHLKRLMRKHGVAEEEAPRACFTRLTEPLTEERLLPALRAALGGDYCDLEVVAFSQQPAPRGELHFELSRLRVPLGGTPETPLLWRGSVEYGERRSMSVWVRVLATVYRREVVALRDLSAGEPIRKENVEERTIAALPEPGWEQANIQAVVGGLPRRTIPAGQAVSRSLIAMPNDVERGEIILVEVIGGAAYLRFEAKADSSGRRGDRILVVNPGSGKRFPAVVSGPRKVEVRPAGTEGQT